MIENYKCKFCESQNLAIRQYKDGCYLVCCDCGQKQLKIKSEQMLQEINKGLINIGDPHNLTFKKIEITKAGVMGKCGNCKTVLYKSWLPRLHGVFDLSNANYCPNCGKKFIGTGK